MRIAMFTDSYMPVLNGVSVSIQTLVEELRSRGHSVHVFTSRYPKHKDNDPNIVRFNAIHTPWTGEYPMAIPPFYPFVRGFRRQNFDIVHTHTPYTVGYVGMRWAESENLPLVSTYHTWYEKYVHYIPFFPRWYLLYKIWKHTNYYYNLCNHVIVPSDAAQRSLKRHFVNRPISVIPTGIPSPAKVDRGQARAAMGLREDEKLLLYVGRIAQEKNIPFLLRAASKVMRENPKTKLALVGEGPFRTEAEGMVRNLGMGDKTKFIGELSRKELDAYYASADLFIFASVTETQGLVIGEAMQFGVPAIAVQGGGASASISEDENGFVVNRDEEQFADACRRVLSNPAVAARLSRGALSGSKLWTSAKMCDEVLEVYASAMNSPQQTPSVAYAHS